MITSGSSQRFGLAIEKRRPVVAAVPSGSASWDNAGQVLFVIDVQGERVGCAISRAALEEVGGTRCYGGAASLACFTRVRPAIELLARRKHQSNGVGIYGRVTLWTTDIDEKLAHVHPAEAAALPRENRT